MRENTINRRHKKYIDPKIQGRITLIVMITAVAYIFLLALFIFAPIAYRMSTESLGSGLQEGADAFLAVHEYFWPAVLLLLSILAWHSIRISHLIAGPVHNFKQRLKAIQNKNFGATVIIRQGDFFSEMMDEINLTTLALKENIQEFQKEDKRLRLEIQNLNMKLQNDSTSIETLKASALDIQKSEEAIHALLGKFQLEKT